MKVVILAGGYGTRLSEETLLKPKPLVEIGTRPIIWHIMKMYEAAGLTEFIICCGYKGSMIKTYFANYFTENYDMTINLATNDIEFHDNPNEKWKITLVDTGLQTMTGGRLKRIKDYLGDDDFCMTYGDGVSDVDIRQLINFHRAHGKKATVTAVPSPGRFGVIEIDDEDSSVSGFYEKPQNEMGFINGGFFVLSPKVLDYVENDATIWERAPMEKLAKNGELMSFVHNGFWRPMDTLRDKRELDRLWEQGEAPWFVYER